MIPVHSHRAAGCFLAFLMACIARPAFAQYTVEVQLEESPFQYSETLGNNRVTRPMEKLKSKEVKLEYTEEKGYLQSLLKALEIPESSQTLVFSKTSLQVRYITRRNPRAIYFNDDTYLGWVNGSSMVEISTADPKLGAAFYTVDMAPWRPKIQRVNDDCLGCHATSLTQGIPGHTVRSVMPSIDGSVDVQLESFITNDTSPFSERWGGWYVTGIHGAMAHRGNAYLRGGSLDTKGNANRMNLRDEFDTGNYLSPYSDIVALMVLEHQTQMHNAMVRADFFVRQLLHEASELNSDAQGDPEWEAKISLIAREVVDRLLFCSEAELTDDVKGSVVFLNHFQDQGKKDSQGRSLREFDLKRRMFKYPCSYLIYSDAFRSLLPILHKEIVRQVQEVLTGNDSGDKASFEKYSHLSSDDRASMMAILSETHPDFSTSQPGN